MLNFLKKINKTVSAPRGVWVTAQPGVVTLVHSGINCPLDSKLAREVSRELIRFADLADKMIKP